MKASRNLHFPICIFFLLVSLCPLSAQVPPPVDPFDPSEGNAPTQAIIPRVIPVIFSTVSPGDAPLVLRTTTLLTNSWFDAIAPYGETSVGVYSRLGRRPIAERTDTNRNIAIFYASYRTLLSLYPEFQSEWDAMLASANLDPNDTSTDLTTAIGIGNSAGNAVVAARENDGMNQLGNEAPRGKNVGPTYNTNAYSDYTGFRPANTAYRLRFPGKWQPAVTTTGWGIYKVQQFVTPQYRFTTPYSYESPRRFRVGPPLASLRFNSRAYRRQAEQAEYRRQADQVIAASAAMTDEQKMLSELFDNKINSLGFSALFASIASNLTLEDFVHYDFLTNIAAFDTGIVIWQEKARWNAVRPFSAIRHLYAHKKLTAWGGPFQGTVDDITGKEWTSYLPVADHPEYPSASASFCSAHAQTSRLFLDSDILGWSFPVPKGSSTIEPGFTPQADLTLSFETWTEFEEICGQTRFWSGVHFPNAIPPGQKIGKKIGTLAYEFLVEHINGTAPAL
jgi:hypothetical protein